MSFSSKKEETQKAFHNAFWMGYAEKENGGR